MDIAVCFEKIFLDEDMFIFKPINIIKGEHFKDSNLFEAEFGYVYENINTNNDNCEYYFSCLTNMEELKSKFGNEDEKVLLSNYLNLCSENYFIGYYDYEENTMKTKLIPLSYVESEDKIEVSLSKEFNEQKTLNGSYGIVFYTDKLKELRNIESLEKIRTQLDKLINELEKCNEQEKDNKRLKINTMSGIKMSLEELRKEVLKKIVAQDQAVNDITREIYMNMTSKDPRNKSHILVTGPTGTGKTEIVSTISKMLDLPYFEADATAYTKEGYVGKSVYSMLDGLIDAADGDIKQAQNGILIIDEIDKKLSGKSDDVSGIDVLYSLLKIMDRGIVEVNRKDGICKENVMFDTSNLTIILMGAFENIYNLKIKPQKRSIGFNTSEISIPKREIVLTKQDLIKNGFPAQALGRIGDVTSTNYFTVKDLKRILTKSEISALLILKKYFKESLGVDLLYTDGYVEQIAKKADEMGTNARELKPLVKESVKYAFDDIINTNKKILKLTKETACDNKKYIIK